MPAVMRPAGRGISIASMSLMPFEIGLTPKFSCGRVHKSERSEPPVDRPTAATPVTQHTVDLSWFRHAGRRLSIKVGQWLVDHSQDWLSPYYGRDERQCP